MVEDRPHNSTLPQAEGAFCMRLCTSAGGPPAHATAATPACCPCINRCMLCRNSGVAAKPTTKLTNASISTKSAALLRPADACRCRHQARSEEVRSQLWWAHPSRGHLKARCALLRQVNTTAPSPMARRSNAAQETLPDTPSHAIRRDEQDKLTSPFTTARGTSRGSASHISRAPALATAIASPAGNTTGSSGGPAWQKLGTS